MKMESCLYVLNVPMSGIQTKLQKKKDLWFLIAMAHVLLTVTLLQLSKI